MRKEENNGYIFLDVCALILSKISAIIETTVIIDIMGYSNTAKERTCKRAEYDIGLIDIIVIMIS